MQQPQEVLALVRVRQVIPGGAAHPSGHPRDLGLDRRVALYRHDAHSLLAGIEPLGPDPARAESGGCQDQDNRPGLVDGVLDLLGQRPVAVYLVAIPPGYEIRLHEEREQLSDDEGLAVGPGIGDEDMSGLGHERFPRHKPGQAGLRALEIGRGSGPSLCRPGIMKASTIFAWKPGHRITPRSVFHGVASEARPVSTHVRSQAGGGVRMMPEVRGSTS